MCVNYNGSFGNSVGTFFRNCYIEDCLWALESMTARIRAAFELQTGKDDQVSHKSEAYLSQPHKFALDLTIQAVMGSPIIFL